MACGRPQSRRGEEGAAHAISQAVFIRNAYKKDKKLKGFQQKLNEDMKTVKLSFEKLHMSPCFQHVLKSCVPHFGFEKRSGGKR